MIKPTLFLSFILFFCLTHIDAQKSDTLYISEDIQLIHLKDSIFIHVTWDNSEQYGRFSSNGMIIIKNGQAIMIDTPMDNEKTKVLTAFIEDTLNVKLVKLIIGHYHTDCLGGIDYIQSKGIESVANFRTVDKCKELNLPISTVSFSDSLVFDFQGEKIICKYFGGGHTIDNITVWIPGKKILFGGCLIRSKSTRSLGNITDAVLTEWDSTVKNIIDTYPEIKTVIPGHGAFGDAELLNHTGKLVKAHNNNKAGH